MRQNERQERPRPPQERALKSSIRDIPPAPLGSSNASPEKLSKMKAKSAQDPPKSVH